MAQEKIGNVTMIIDNILRIVTVSTGGMPNKIFHSKKRLFSEYFRGKATCVNDKLPFDKVHDEWLKKFELNGVSEPKESINIIMSHVLGSEKVGGDHLKKTPLSDEQIQLLNRLCECRLAR
ncbi:hypothetical protein J437_LFUL010667 [Ladona fulva]|uniref:Uncharacterized protein n=1 Tax=Ladona fulva TaxID=123851 RepID=A0A8K0K937_LADFU|nr:hypothetical protein J437_LFUL010667 [Ladona fulva]